MDLIAMDVEWTYVSWSEQLRMAYAAEDDPRGRALILDRLLERNDRTILLLETIRTIREGYRKLPAAHDELRQRLDAQGAPLETVKQLYDEAQRLRTLYEELARSEGGEGSE
jgi:hypothetical protein